MADGTVKDIEDEIPFELPEGWAWCHFGDIATVINGKNQSKVENPNGKYPIYGSGGIMGRADDYICPKNCTIIGRKGSINNPIFVEENFWNVDTAFGLYPSKNVLPKHLFYFCKYFDFTKLDSSTTLPSLTKTNIQRILCPLPPLTEQEHIVSEIENTFAKIDILEQNQAELQTSIKQAKSKILDLAIHGKLVAQDPNDESASVLLEKLRAEKEAKIKSGELKRDKNDSYIYKSATDNCHFEKFADGTETDIEAEIPFDIPESWAWTKIRCVSSEILYGVSESAKETGKYKLLRITDIQDDKVNWDSVPFTDYPEEKVTNYFLKNGDIVFARTGATVGKSYLVENLTVESIYASYLIRIRTSQVLNQKYIKYYFGSQTYWNQITDKSSGIGQPNVNGTSLANLYIPLPPLAEQKRIVEKIENAFAKLDFIAEQLA